MEQFGCIRGIFGYENCAVLYGVMGATQKNGETPINYFCREAREARGYDAGQ